jgi:hypothetical protein
MGYLLSARQKYYENPVSVATDINPSWCSAFTDIRKVKTSKMFVINQLHMLYNKRQLLRTDNKALFAEIESTSEFVREDSSYHEADCRHVT